MFYFLAIVEITNESGTRSLIPVAYSYSGQINESERDTAILNAVSATCSAKRIKLLIPITHDQFECVVSGD